MAREDRIKVEGLPELRKALDNTAEGLKELKAINKRAADIVYTAGQPNVPRRSGALAGSGRASGTKAGGAVKYNKPYSQPIHWGWAKRNIAPHPWLSDALVSREEEVIDVYDKEVNRLLDKAASK